MKITSGYFFSLLLTATAHADVVDVRMHGALVAEPCVIQPGDEVVRLDFGSVIEKGLYLHGRTPSKAFALTLSNCDLSLGKAVTVTFSGGESGSLPGLLALSPASQASGIAIGLETASGVALPLNQKSSKLALSAGTNVMQLRAYVQGEPAALSGKSIGRGAFSATANFKLDYE